MLYGTAPLVYQAGRYSWLYKTIGVVQYVNAHGQLNPSIDIYQNWPGFFALAAWFGKVAGIGSPLAYAKWAQLVFELAALPLLYLIYDAVSLTVRQRWLALLLYSASNWIGQDYFSPQGLGTLLSLGIMAIVMRRFYIGNRFQFARNRSAGSSRVAEPKQKETKPAAISTQEVWEAYQAVRSHTHQPGVDGVTIADFDRDLTDNLQKVWAQMSSGIYFPAPERAVLVTTGGRERWLSVPTINDRIVQTVAARRLETRLEEIRQAERDNRISPSTAAAESDWAIEFNARTVFSSCRHDLMLRAMEASTDQTPIIEYVRQCLKGPVQNPDGSLSARSDGMPPGSPLSPVLADLFLHYAFDVWMGSHFPEIRFERYLNTAVVYCTNKREAASLRVAIVQRLEQVGLTLRPSRIRVTQREGGLRTAAAAATSALRSEPLSEQRRSAGERRKRGVDKASRWRSLAPSRSSAPFYVTLMLIFFALSLTHELSPYILVVQLGVLAGGRLLRPRWLPIALSAIAIGYLLPRLDFVNSHYGLLSSIGSFFSNAAPPSSSSGFIPVPASQHLIERCEEVLSLGMWVLAIAGAWVRRRSGRTVFALVFLAYSSILVLAVQAYGNEGILRVYLFSLPWTAALAASALAPLPALIRKPQANRIWRLLGLGSLRKKLSPGILSAPLALGIALALFFPAFFGDDSFNYMSQTEVATVTSFLQHAPIGPVYCASVNAPVADTSRYNLFPLPTIFGGLTSQATPGIASLIAQNSEGYTNGRGPAYVLITPSMISYSKAYGLVSPESFTTLLSSLKHSPAWKLLVSRDGTVIYELPPTASG
jgi:retron-type reverse transcriptase